MNILITGGCGFVGSNLAITLRKQGQNIHCLDNLSRRGSEFNLQRILEYDCKFIHGDIRNSDDLDKMGANYDIMLECSAEPSVLAGSKGSDAYSLINNNLIGFINCVEYCRKNSIAVIFLSTSRVYPYNKIDSFTYEELDSRFEIKNNNPFISRKGITVDFPLKGIRSLYGATKLTAEYILQEYSANYNIPSIINRVGVIAGPWQLGKVDQGVFTFWLANHYFKKPLNYIGYGGKGKQLRDLLHIDDLISLINVQLNSINKYRGQIFNVGGSSFSSLSLMETTNICQIVTGNKVNISSILQNRPADLIWYKTDNTLTTEEFNWKPQKNAEIIIQDIYLWLRQNETIFKKIF